jgi:hypothetical protein
VSPEEVDTMAERRWSDLSRAKKATVVAAVSAQLALAAAVLAAALRARRRVPVHQPTL